MVLTKESLEKIRNVKDILLDLQSDRKLYEECLGLWKVELVNPAVLFTKEAKKGKLLHLSDEDYFAKLSMVEKQAEFFKGYPSCTVDYREKINSLMRNLVDVIDLLDSMLVLDEIQEKMEMIPKVQAYEEDDWLEDMDMDIPVEVETAEEVHSVESVDKEDSSLKRQQVLKKVYAGGTLSKADLLMQWYAYDTELEETFISIRDDMLKDTKHFLDKGDGNLYGVDGTPYIKASTSYRVSGEFYSFLTSLPDWNDIADGLFETEMASRMNAKLQKCLKPDRMKYIGAW